MEEVVTIGLDIAKSVFQVHGVNSAGAAVLRPPFVRTWPKPTRPSGRATVAACWKRWPAPRSISAPIAIIRWTRRLKTNAGSVPGRKPPPRRRRATSSQRHPHTFLRACLRGRAPASTFDGDTE